LSAPYGEDLAHVHHEAFGDLARRAAEVLLVELAHRRHRQGTVVDLGCGTGILAGVVSQAGYDVLGVDPSEDMLRLAAREAPGATLVQASVVDVELPRDCLAVTAV
jgi:predicted RNA methylase